MAVTVRMLRRAGTFLMARGRIKLTQAFLMLCSAFHEFFGQHGSGEANRKFFEH